MFIIVFISRSYGETNKKYPAHYEMATYASALAVEEDEGFAFNSTPLENSQTPLTLSQDQQGYNRMDDAESVNNPPTSFVNEEAIYVNSSFKGTYVAIAPHK